MGVPLGGDVADYSGAGFLFERIQVSGRDPRFIDARERGFGARAFWAETVSTRPNLTLPSL